MKVIEGILDKVLAYGKSKKAVAKEKPARKVKKKKLPIRTKA